MVAEMIRDIRRRNYLNQTAFANKIGVTQGTVSQWEHGLIKPSSEQLLAISTAFNISIDDLLRGENIGQDNPNAPRTSEARIISEGVDRMPAKDREKALNILKTVYADYFEQTEEKNA